MTSPPVTPSGDILVFNGASLRADQGLAPGSIAVVRGTIPNGVDEILVNGAAAQIMSADAEQIQFVVPISSPPGPATISLRSAGSEIANGQATLTVTGPGLFVRDNTDPTQPGSVVNEDSTPNSIQNPAPQESVVQIAATGYGPLDAANQAPVEVLFADSPGDVVSSGPSSDTPGLWLIRARVPNGSSGQIPIFLIAGGFASNAVTIWVQ